MLKDNENGSAKTTVIFFVVIWGLALAAAFIFGGANRGTLMAGITLAAFISLVLMIKNLVEQWSGVITEIKKERIDTSNDREHPFWQDVDFAYLKLDNGKTKKMRSMKGWEVGDRIEKRKGESMFRVSKKDAPQAEQPVSTQK